MSSTVSVQVGRNFLPALLKPLIEAWGGVMDQYIDQSGGEDLPYWYNERANASFLAAAAWKIEDPLEFRRLVQAQSSSQ